MGEKRRQGSAVRGNRAGAGHAEIRRERGQARCRRRGGPHDVPQGQRFGWSAVREEAVEKFEADAAKEHDKKEAKASVSADASEGRATSLVSMTKSDKERLTAIAKAHGLSLSAFFRLAADEYIANHDW